MLSFGRILELQVLKTAKANDAGMMLRHPIIKDVRTETYQAKYIFHLGASNLI